MLVVFLVSPRIGEDEIKHTTLRFEQMNITNPGTSNFIIQASAVLGNLQPIGGVIQRTCTRIRPQPRGRNGFFRRAR